MDGGAFINEEARQNPPPLLTSVLNIRDEQGRISASSAGGPKTAKLQLGKLYRGELLVPQDGDLLAENAMFCTTPDRFLNNGHRIFEQGPVYLRDISPTPCVPFNSYEFVFRPCGGNDDSRAHFDIGYAAIGAHAAGMWEWIETDPLPYLPSPVHGVTRAAMKAAVTGWELWANIALAGQELLQSACLRPESETKLTLYADLEHLSFRFAHI